MKLIEAKNEGREQQDYGRKGDNNWVRAVFVGMAAGKQSIPIWIICQEESVFAKS